MKRKSRKLSKLAGVTIFFIFIFMVIAIVQYQTEERMTVLPDQFEYYWDAGWDMVSLDQVGMPGLAWEEEQQIQKLARQALESGNGRKVELPYTGSSKPGDIVVFSNTLPQDFAGLTLHFSAANAMVRVVLDDKVIYQNEFERDMKSGELHGKPSEKLYGNNEHFVNIPNVFEDGRVWIEITSNFPNVAATLGSVQIETRDIAIIGVMGNNIADIGCCLIIAIMSVILFALAVIRCYTHQPARGEVFLGLTGLAAGLYCFIDTDTLNIFYDIQEAYEMQEYLVLLVPLLLTLYFEKNLRTLYPHRFSVLLAYVSVNGLLQILLQRTGIRSMEEMVNFSAAAVGVVCVAAIISLIQYDYRNKRFQTLLSVLSMLVLMSGGIVNVLAHFLMDRRVNVAGQYSMALFSVMMAVMHVLQLSIEYRAGAEQTAQLLAEKVKAAELQNTQLALAKQDADAARQEALAANEAKGKFLAHMSHEIRTPINAVLGMVEMILRESREQSIREYAMDIYMAGQTLLSLINDILDFSKIESGKMEIVPVEYDFSSMVHDLANMASQRAKDKNIKLETSVDSQIPSRLFGDDVRIRQVLTNILTNAVKYTHEGTVWLRVGGSTKGSRAVLKFEVEDTGIGIKEEDLPKLSTEFERIEEERNRNIEGSGLGMSITIQLLALLGSRLQVESVYGKGSKFYFELEQQIVDDTPIGDFESRVRQIAEDYHYSTKFSAPDAEILVVDDNAVNRKVFRNLLKETLIKVTDAAGGAECLELVQKNHYDLIFLDHMMPQLDGVETLHLLKELSDCPCQDTPVVVLTANAVSGAKEKYLSEGFDDFLSKPIVPDKLEDMIKKMLPKELLQEAVAGAKEAARLSDGAGSADDASFIEGLPQVDGLDWQYAWMHLPDQELLEYTVKEFYGQIESAADRLEQAYEQITEPEQLDTYRIQVHAMKSLSATVGIMPLSGVAKILEYAARDGRTDTIRSMTPAFLEEWRSYVHKLQGVFGIGETAKQEVTDHSLILALVEMVRVSMQEMDIDQADSLMGQLKAYEYPQEVNENIQKLAEAVTNLDTEETDRLADLLIGLIEQ